MIGFKGFDKNLKCRDFQFEVGKTYKIKGDLKICENGFHFCKRLDDVSNYYSDPLTRICVVRGIGQFKEEGDKVAFESIEILYELSSEEIKNTKSNYNSGNYNSGGCNSGNYNSGGCNSGDCNSGGCNSGNHNSGYFNKSTPLVRLFDKESSLKFDSPEIVKLNNIICKVKPLLSWIPLNQMTEKEKQDNPSSATTQGFLRNEGKQSWSSVTKEDFEFIKSLPNFNAQTFKEITGVDLSEPKTIKVIVDDKEFEIDIEKAKELGLIK